MIANLAKNKTYVYFVLQAKSVNLRVFFPCIGDAVLK